MTIKLQFDAEDSKALLSIDKINKGLDKIGVSASKSQQNVSKLGNVSTKKTTADLEAMNKSLAKIEATTTSVTKGFKNLFIAATAFAGVTFAFKGLTDAGDTLTKMENKLSLFVERGEDLEYVKNSLKSIALESGLAAESATEMFSRFSMSRLSQMYDPQTLLDITEAISLTAGMTGGGPGVDAALVQLSQAFSNNFSAAAQELNSINEQAPAVARLIADGLSEVLGEDIGVDALKKMAEEGVLTTELVAEAILTQTGKVQDSVASMTLSMSKGVNALKVGFSSFFGEFDKAIGLSSWLGEQMYYVGGMVLAVSRGIGEDIGRIQEKLTGFYETLKMVWMIASILVFEPLAASFGNMVSKVGEWSQKLLSVVSAPLQAFWDFVANIFYSLYMYVVGNSVYRDMITGIVEWTNRLWELVKAGYTKFKQSVIDVFNSLSNIIMSIFGSAKQKGTSLYAAIKSYFSFDFNKSTDFLRIKTSLVKSFSKIAGFIRTIYLSFSKQVTKVFNQIKNKEFKKAFESILNFDFSTLKLVVQPIKRLLGNVFKAISDPITKGFSTDFLRIKKTLSNSLKTVAGFVRTIYLSFSKQIVNIFDKVKNSQFKDAFQSILNFDFSTLRLVFDPIKRFFSRIYQSVFDFLQSKFDIRGKIAGISSVFTSVRSFFTNFFQNAFTYYKATIASFNQGIGSVASSISNTLSVAFSDLLLVGLLGGVALASPGARVILFSALKRLLVFALLPLMNNTVVTSSIAMWTESLTNYIAESFSNSVTRMSSGQISNIANALFINAKPDETAIGLFARTIGNVLNAVGGSLVGTIVTGLTGDAVKGEEAGKKIGALVGQGLGIGLAAVMFGPVRSLIKGLFSLIFIDELSAFQRRLIDGLFGASGGANTARRMAGALSMLGRATGLSVGFALGDTLAKKLQIDPNSLEALGIKVGSAIVGAIAGGLVATRSFAMLSGATNSVLIRLGSAFAGVAAGSTLGPIAARAIVRSILGGLMFMSFAFSDIGQMIISSIADSLVAGSGKYSNMIAAALSAAIFAGPPLMRAIRSRFGLLSGAIISILALNLADKTAIEEALLSAGVGVTWADSVLEGLIAGIIVRRMGFRKRIAAAIGGAFALGDMITDQSEPGVTAKSFSNAFDAAMAAGFTTKNPWATGIAAGGTFIGSLIFYNLDQSMQDKLVGWGASVASYIKSALGEITIENIGIIFSQGFDSLGKTLDSVIEKVYAAYDSVLKFLGLREEDVLTVRDVTSVTEYQQARADAKRRLTEKSTELEAFNSANPAGSVLTPAKQAERSQLILERNILSQQFEEFFGSTPEGRSWIEKEAEALVNSGQGMAELFLTTISAKNFGKDLVNPEGNVYQPANTLDILRIEDEIRRLEGVVDRNVDVELERLAGLANDNFAERDSLVAQYPEMRSIRGGETDYSGPADELNRAGERYKAEMEALAQDIPLILEEKANASARISELEALLEQSFSLQNELTLARTTLAGDAFALEQSSAEIRVQQAEVFKGSVEIYRQLITEWRALNRELSSLLPNSRDTSVVPRSNFFATGGFVSGSGTGTSDSIPAMLSNGEYVINASSTRKFLPLLQSINSGSYGKFAEGGMIGGNSLSVAQGYLSSVTGYNDPLRILGWLGAMTTLEGASNSVNSSIYSLFGSKDFYQILGNISKGNASELGASLFKNAAIELSATGVASKMVSFIPYLGPALSAIFAMNATAKVGQGYSRGARQLGYYEEIPSWLDSSLSYFENESTGQTIIDYVRNIATGGFIASWARDALSNAVLSYSGVGLNQKEFEENYTFSEGGLVGENELTTNWFSKSYNPNDVTSVKEVFEPGAYSDLLGVEYNMLADMANNIRDQAMFSMDSQFKRAMYDEGVTGVTQLGSGFAMPITVGGATIGGLVSAPPIKADDTMENSLAIWLHELGHLYSYFMSTMNLEGWAEGYMVNKDDTLREESFATSTAFGMSTELTKGFNKLPGFIDTLAGGLASYSSYNYGKNNLLSLFGLEKSKNTISDKTNKSVQAIFAKSSKDPEKILTAINTAIAPNEITLDQIVNGLQGYASGGYISGAGTSTSDSIPAMLSNGEYVINAASTKKFLPLLQAINSGAYGKFSGGGLIDTVVSYGEGVMKSVGESKVVLELTANIERYRQAGAVETAANRLGYTLSAEAYEAVISGAEDYNMLLSSSSMLQNGYAYALYSTGDLLKIGAETVDDLGKSVDRFSGTAKDATEELSEAEKKAKELAENLKAIGEGLVAMTTMDQVYFAQAGYSGAETMLQSFKDSIGGFLTGELSFKDMIGGVLDTFTNQIISTFVDSMVNSLFNKFDLTSVFNNIFTNQAYSGAQTGGGMLSPANPNLLTGTASLTPGAPIPVTVTNMGVLGNALGGGAATPAAGAVGEQTSIFQSMFSGISELFSGLFGFITKLFSGIFSSIGGLFGFADGGYISGPGGPKSDSIMAMVSNGEYVVNAATTKRWLPFLEQINANDGKLPRFSDGGAVGPASPTVFKTMADGSSNNKSAQIFNINVTGDVSLQARKEIARMIPEITAGVNMTNRERGSR
jgi:tape measure domain-containing protein